MVDAVVFAADNTMIADRVRMSWQPPVRELGETDDKYVIGTAEILSSPRQKRYGKRIKEMRQDSKWVKGSPTQP